MFYCRFDVVRGKTELEVTESASGGLILSWTTIGKIDTRKCAMALLAVMPGNFEYQSLEGDSHEEEILEHFNPLIAQQLKVRAEDVYWCKKDEEGGLDWMRPTLRDGRVSDIAWSEVVMPPYPRRSREALCSIYPDAHNLFDLT